MGYTERFTERWQLLATIYASGATTEQNTGYVNVANMVRLVVMLHPVSTGAAAIDVDCEQGTNTSGAGAKTLDSGGKDVAIGAGDTAPSIIEIKPEEFDVDGGFDCLNVEATPAGTASFVVEVWGMTQYPPADTTNLDSVTD